MFEAGFTYILSKSLMNTRTSLKYSPNGGYLFFYMYKANSGFEVGAVVNRCPVDIESRE